MARKAPELMQVAPSGQTDLFGFVRIIAYKSNRFSKIIKTASFSLKFSSRQTAYHTYRIHRTGTDRLYIRRSRKQTRVCHIGHLTK